MTSYNTDMEAAPREGTRFVALVPTGDSDGPISEEMAYWDESLQRFEGEWRYIDGPMSESDPIAWLALPPIPEALDILAMQKAA